MAELSCLRSLLVARTLIVFQDAKLMRRNRVPLDRVAFRKMVVHGADESARHGGREFERLPHEQMPLLKSMTSPKSRLVST